MQSLVKARQVSVLNAAAAELDAQADTSSPVYTTRPQTPKSNARFMLLASVALVILGAGALIIAYMARQNQLNIAAQDRTQTLTDNALVFVEHRTTLDITDRIDREILGDLTRMRNASRATLGSITQINLQTRTFDPTANQTYTYSVSAPQALAALGLSLPESLMSRLGEEYLIGMHMADTNAPFIILTTTSYDYAFAALLDWEKSAERELAPWFTTPGSASSARTYDDITVQNIDARVVRDTDKNLKLLYTFLDRNTVLIASSIHTLTEISQRYKARQASDNTFQ